jgi:ATP-dependent helicase/DNAse subunit B
VKPGLKVELEPELLQQIAELERSEAFMALITALSESHSYLHVMEMRNQLRAGNSHEASRSEAAAQVWDELPDVFRQIADEQRRTRKI